MRFNTSSIEASVTLSSRSLVFFDSSYVRSEVCRLLALGNPFIAKVSDLAWIVPSDVVAGTSLAETFFLPKRGGSS
jgi:hypothetical protein